MIRRITRRDAEAVSLIYSHYIEHSVATFEETPVQADDFYMRCETVEASGLPWLVAEDRGSIVGYAYATKWSERSAYRHTVETSVYIAPDELSKGWGKRLYQAVFAELRTLPIRTVIAGITLPNAASVALHEYFGMKKVAHFSQVGFKFDQWLDVGYWQCKLADH